jgi:hypothetical protein
MVYVEWSLTSAHAENDSHVEFYHTKESPLITCLLLPREGRREGSKSRTPPLAEGGVVDQ